MSQTAALKLWRVITFMGKLRMPIIVHFLCLVSLAQRPPAPPFTSIPSADISVDFLLPVKDANLSKYGVGGQFTADHYLNNNFGLQLQADYVKANIIHFREAGIRGGAIFKFFSRSAAQPYLHGLVGYSRVQYSLRKLPPSWHNGTAILGGAGLDFPLRANWRGRVGADAQKDLGLPDPMEEGRCLLGFSYHFSRR